MGAEIIQFDHYRGDASAAAEHISWELRQSAATLMSIMHQGHKAEVVASQGMIAEAFKSIADLMQMIREEEREQRRKSYKGRMWNIMQQNREDGYGI